MYAIIETGGKQYSVKVGDFIYTEKIDAEEENIVTFLNVLAIGKDDGKFLVGTPTLKEAKVTGKVIKNGKGKKITVFTYKAKKNEKRKLGHRQPFTKIQIENIEV